MERADFKRIVPTRLIINLAMCLVFIALIHSYAINIDREFYVRAIILVAIFASGRWYFNYDIRKTSEEETDPHKELDKQIEELMK